MSLVFNGIIDSTLREGEQTPGVCFNHKQRCDIIALLHQIGIEEIELGVSSTKNFYLRELFPVARELTRGQTHLGLWCRCLYDDIAFAASCQPDILSLSIPASDLHINQRLRKDRNWVLATLRQSIYQARDTEIPFLSLGIEDATRADPDFLEQLAGVAAESGVQRLRLADTVGIASPATITTMVQRIIKQSGLACGIHTHNDFGMATANAIAAVEAGASWLDSTVLGLGERAGNCRLEEVAAFICLQQGVRSYNLRLLPAICRTVSEAAAVPIAGNHPIVGSDIFTCETGLHLHGLTVNPATYEPYAPDQVNATRTLRYGHKSGKRALRNHLQSLGLVLDDNRIEDLSSKLRSLSPLYPRGLTDPELLQLATS